MIQFIDLIHNDDFLLRHNISVPTYDFYDVTSAFTPFFYSVDKYKSPTGRLKLENLSATWRTIYSTPTVEFLTKWGLCYSFNIADASDLVNLSKLDF